MTTQDLVNQFPRSSDLLAMLGLERRNPSETVVSAFAVFGLGVAIGAALGLLLAPKSGEDIREELGQQMSRVRDGLRATQPAPEA